MINFTESERAAMARELAVNGFSSLLRLIVLHDKNIPDVINAKYRLGTFCSASGTTIKSWSERGVRGVYVKRVLEFAEGYGLPIKRHQLAPTKAIVEQWLEYDYNLIQSGLAKSSTFKDWDITARGGVEVDKRLTKTVSAECLMSMGEV